MIACFAIAAGAATFADSVRLSEDVARRRHRATPHSHGETATASGARQRLVRVGRTPWAGAGLSGQPPRRRSPRPSLLRGEESEGLIPRSRLAGPLPISRDNVPEKASAGRFVPELNRDRRPAGVYWLRIGISANATFRRNI